MANNNPIITASVIDVNGETIALTGDRRTLIRYHSHAQASMSVEAQGGAAIDLDMLIIRNNSTCYGDSGIFYNVESNEFRFSAEDSNGNVGTAVFTAPMIPYIRLTCNIAHSRPDGAGNMTVACFGNYYNDTFGEVANTLVVQYRYKEAGGSYGEWSNMDVYINGNSYYATADLTGLDYEIPYYFETRAIDKLETTEPSTSGRIRTIPLFHWGENDFVFEVPVTFKAGAEGAESEGDKTIDGELKVTGNLTLKGDGNYGNTIFFGDGAYCYITENEDDVMTIRANRINLNANGVYVDGYPIPILDKGSWTPSLNSSAISSYTTQYGWYMKMNQTVTVGFFIKATCRSGYDGTNISISGLPYTPLFSAAGGGLCSGAYISGGHNFQCFVAETSGLITTRIQACNNTSATNLSTSSVGCSYRSGGGELTLSGTITFMSTS